MTEVELKAKQLVNYYHENLDGLYIEAREVTAIKFAIYHVEEMLSQFKQLFDLDPLNGGFIEANAMFYASVKEKLENCYNEL